MATIDALIRSRDALAVDNANLLDTIKSLRDRNTELAYQNFQLARRNTELAGRINELHGTLKLRRQIISDLRAQLAEAASTTGPTITSTATPGGLLPLDPTTDLRNRLARALDTLRVYEDRLAVYEGRPSRVTCPRPCCTSVPAVKAA